MAQFVGAEKTASIVTANSVTVPVPAAAQSGDLLLAFVGISANSLSNNSFDVTTGWTLQQSSYSGSTTDTQYALYTRISDGTETSQVFTKGGNSGIAVGIICAYRGAAFDGLQINNTGSAQGSHGTTVLGEGQVVVAFHRAADDAITAAGAPTGFTLRESEFSVEHSNCFAADLLTPQSAGVYTAPNWTHTLSGTGSGDASGTIVVRLDVTATFETLEADEASVSVGGEDISFISGFSLPAEAAEATLSGEDLVLGVLFQLEQSAVGLSGTDAGLPLSLLLGAESGVSGLSGPEVSLGVSFPQFLLDAETGQCFVGGDEAAFVFDPLTFVAYISSSLKGSSQIESSFVGSSSQEIEV